MGFGFRARGLWFRSTLEILARLLFEGVRNLRIESFEIVGLTPQIRSLVLLVWADVGAVISGKPSNSTVTGLAVYYRTETPKLNPRQVVRDETWLRSCRTMAVHAGEGASFARRRVVAYRLRVEEPRLRGEALCCGQAPAKSRGVPDCLRVSSETTIILHMIATAMNSIYHRVLSKIR